MAICSEYDWDGSTEYGGPGPRRDPERSEQILKTCRTCGVGELHWVRTVHGWRLWEKLVGHQIIFEHVCDPIERAEIIASTEQYTRDNDYAAHRKRLGKPL